MIRRVLAVIQRHQRRHLENGDGDDDDNNDDDDDDDDSNDESKSCSWILKEPNRAKTV